jgi:acetyl esterase/lipase
MLPGLASDATAAGGCSAAAAETVAYEQLAGVPLNSTSLDLYAPAAGCVAGGGPAPVVIWVHGGGYHNGDKANQVADKVRLFNDLGYVFISVNYRLTVAGDPASAHYPDHYRDVAAAVAWTRAKIASRGGDPRRIALFGHSAGADIVSNVAVNPAWLGERGLGLDDLRCAGPLDTEGFDKVASSDDGEDLHWLDSLGNNPNYKTETSANYLIRPRTGIAPVITVFRGSAQRQQIENAFAQRLRDAGVQTTLIDARSLSHNEVNTKIGAAGDTVMTGPIVDFLADCFAPRPPARPALRRRPAAVVHLGPRRRRAKVTFAFSSSTDGARYQCRLGGAAFKSCRSPRSYTVGRGRHVFSVRAVSVEGAGPVKTLRFRVESRR